MGSIQISRGLSGLSSGLDQEDNRQQLPAGAEDDVGLSGDVVAKRALEPNMAFGVDGGARCDAEIAAASLPFVDVVCLNIGSYRCDGHIIECKCH